MVLMMVKVVAVVVYFEFSALVNKQDKYLQVRKGSDKVRKEFEFEFDSKMSNRLFEVGQVRKTDYSK